MLARSPATALALIVLAAAAAPACGGAREKASQPDEDAASIEAALDSDNGGYSTADEAPAFGDAAYAQMPVFDPALGDPTDLTAPIIAEAGARRWRIALVWGHLPSPRDAEATDVEPQPMDWTGAVSVQKGAIGVRRTLLFDGNDHLLPRTSPNVVGFVSHTLPHVDGLLLAVAVPAAAPPVLRFDTASLVKDIDLSRLQQDVGGVVYLSDGRNGLFAIGYEDRPGCAEGFLYGRWIKVRPALGKFRGHVVDGDGNPRGHVRGIWGHARRRNAQVFFGKYVDRDGDFRGLLGGTYGNGEFRGLWATVDPKDAGKLAGFYSDGYEKADGRGGWIGRWTEKCGL